MRLPTRRNREVEPTRQPPRGGRAKSGAAAGPRTDSHMESYRCQEAPTDRDMEPGRGSRSRFQVAEPTTTAITAFTRRPASSASPCFRSDGGPGIGDDTGLSSDGVTLSSDGVTLCDGVRSMIVSDRQRDRWRRNWDRGAASYDPPMRLLDRVLFRDTREWLCRRATGDVLEVAVGTGLNLPHYPPGIRLVGIDLSAPMLAIAERRAAELGRTVQLRVGDAEDLDIPDGSVDTVVCTFSLCGIPDHHRAVAEMARVLRPGGRLLLADHIASSYRPVRGVQRLAELVSVPAAGEHFRRRPLHEVEAAGLEVTQRERFALGVVERIVAAKPAVHSEVRRSARRRPQLP